MGELDAAVERLTAGGLCAFPTETVYGLGARADRDDAVAKIFAAKGRPSNNPLIVHVLSLAEASTFADVSAVAERAAEAFWPGPLTLVLPLKSDAAISPLVLAGNRTVAVRVPRHPMARALLEAVQLPLAAPSANRSGRVSPTTAAHVRDEFGDDLIVLDGGACAAGLESTILDVTQSPPRLLRPGTTTRRALRDLLGEVALPEPTNMQDGSTARDAMIHESGRLTAPGQLSSHYAPSKPVSLNVTEPADDQILIGFGPTPPAPLNLSVTGDQSEAAHRLFDLLRQADRAPQPRIAFAPIPADGIGRAINDRLNRAAAPRPKPEPPT